MPHLSPDEIEKIITGRIKIYWQVGKDSKYRMTMLGKMTEKQRGLYEKAKRELFVYDRPSIVSNAFFQWCETQGTPYLKITKRRKYADVSCDRITVNCNTKDFELTEEELTEVELLLRHKSCEGANMGVGNYNLYSDKVLLEDAEGLAREIYRITTRQKKVVV